MVFQKIRKQNLINLIARWCEWMARKRDPRRDEAFLIYEKNGGKIALVKIANILGLPPGTIRGWRSKDRWDEKLNGTFQSKGTERSKKQRNVPNGSVLQTGTKMQKATKVIVGHHRLKETKMR